MLDQTPVEMREDSPRWVALALAIAATGVPAGVAACAALLQIDNADTLGRMSTAQDFVGVTAFAIGILGISGGSLFLAARWLRRPGVAITPAGVIAYNWRPLLVPGQ